MYRQTRSSFVTVVLTATHSSPPQKKKEKIWKRKPRLSYDSIQHPLLWTVLGMLGSKETTHQMDWGQSSNHKWFVSHHIWSVEELEILSDHTELRMSLNQLPGDTQGFVWKFFYALWINFHSLIQAIDNLPWKTRKAITKETSAALKPGRWDSAHMAFHKSINTILSWTVVIVDKTGFWHLPSNSARTGYTSEGAFCICANCALTLSEPSKRFGY